LLFRIYSIEKKKEKRKQNLLPVESAVGSMKLSFQLAVAASQPATKYTSHAAIVANLQPVQTAARGYFCQC
jgi:hypothetical protein